MTFIFAVWWFGLADNIVGCTSIKVNQHRARLVLGWVI